MLSRRRDLFFWVIIQHVRTPWRLGSQKMLQTQQAVVVILGGDGVLTGLPTTLGPQGLHTITGTDELQEAGVGAIISTTEEGGLARVTAGVTTGWWRETEAEKRCYDKGLLEGR